MKKIALIFAGGTGTRMNISSIPKQFLEVRDKPIIIYTLEVFQNSNDIDEICVVGLKSWIDYLKKLVTKYHITKVKYIVSGGDTGQESIYNGLCEIKSKTSENHIILIHDGVRPLIDYETILLNIQSVIKYGNAITISPATETFININDLGLVENIYDRNYCKIAKAPQSFYLNDIYKVHLEAINDGKNNIIDSASLMKLYGHKLHTVYGPNNNLKITTSIDFFTFKSIIENDL